MAYIIENAQIIRDRERVTQSLLIKGNRIEAIQDHFKQYRYIKMNTEGFILTPTYVLFDPTLPLSSPFQSLKEYMTKNYLVKGSTTIIVRVNVLYENELSEKIRAVKSALMSSPVDFYIAVSIPIRLLTPSFVRKCKKERVPAILVELHDREEIASIAWSWIRDALFPYNSPIIPAVNMEDERAKKGLLAFWKDTMAKEKISALNEQLPEKLPLTAGVLNKIGIYGKSSNMNHGGEVSYNLYFTSKKVNNVDTQQLFLYHSDRLAVTVHKGKVIRAGKQLHYMPGYGEYVQVVTPSYYAF